MSTVRANIYSKTSGADIGTLFNPYTSSAAVATGIYTISGGAYVDLNTRFAKYTGANGTAEATGILSLSAGVYFDLNTRFEKYAVGLTITYAGSPTYTTYTSNGYNVIMITSATDGVASITFSSTKTVNCLLLSAGGNGGKSGSGFASGGGGGAGGVALLTTTTFDANTSYSMALQNFVQGTQLGTLDTKTLGRSTNGGTSSSDTTRTNGGGNGQGYGSGGSSGYNSANLPLAGSAGYLLPTTISFIINGTTYTRVAGGGGGGKYFGQTGTGALGANGGGASGANATPNTGGGGGGGPGNNSTEILGGNGGSGFIAIWYQ